MPIKLTSAQYRVIGIAAIVAALSLAVGIKYFEKSFPEASLDLRVNRNDSLPIALKFLADRGLSSAGYHHAVIFDYDDDAKLYLERTQGLQRMNQLIRGPVRFWHWSHRWFQPQQKEEFRVDVTASGEVAGFDHEIPEARPGADLEPASARGIAEAFLTQVMKRNLDDLEFIESERNKRPARTDHVFTWKQKSVDLGEGSLRVAVEINGDQVTSYQEFVRIPEQWSRDYAKVRSRNESAQIVDELFYAALSVAMIVILILRLKDHDVPVGTASNFGLIGALLYFLSKLNSFSLAEFSYPTTDPYSSFLAKYFTTSALGALGVGVFIFIVVACAEPVYREGLPSLPSLRRHLTWKGLRTRSFFIANVVGIALAFFFFAYQAGFYLIANKFGAWAPSDIPFTNELNTALPWTTVLFTGFFPAVTEEMQFRAFAIPFLAKHLRSWPVAIVLAAFNWGFLHAAYPNQPFYIRGVEVGIGGIITGLVMIRFGILATLIWHYSVDALYTAFLLLRSPNHYLMISGAVTAGIMLVPLFVALVAYLRTGTFEDESEITNAHEGISRPEHAAHPEAALAELGYLSLSRRRLQTAAVLTLIFIAVALIPAYRFGQGIKITKTARDAIRTATSYVQALGTQPRPYRRVAWLRDSVNSLVLRYLVERRPLQAADRIYRQATRLILWEVRFFRPLETEEYRVWVDASAGDIFTFAHILDEDAPGASLTVDQARAIAEKAVTAHGYQLSEFELQDSRAQKRKAREDYTFVWQAKAGDPRNVGDEHYRLQVEIGGNQVTAFSHSFQLPEDWQRARETTGLANAILTGIAALFAIIVVGEAMVLFVDRVRHAHFPWLVGAKVGAVLALIAALAEWNRVGTLEQAYSTSIPLRTFWLESSVSLLLIPLAAGLLGCVLVSFAFSLYPEAQRLLGTTGTGPWRRDALVAVVVSVAAAAALDNLAAIAAALFPAYTPLKVSLEIGELDAWSPALGYFLANLLYATLAAAAAAVLIAVIRRGWSRRARWIYVAGLLLIVAIGPGRAHSLPEFFAAWSLNAITFAVAFAVIAAFYRDNALAYPAAFFAVLVSDDIVRLFSQGAGFYHWNGIILAALTFAVLGWMLVPGRASARKNAALPARSR